MKMDSEKKVPILTSREHEKRQAKVSLLVNSLEEKIKIVSNGATNCAVLNIPPKPPKKKSQLPQVPLSKLVKDTHEPLYSQPLQSFEVSIANTFDSNAASLPSRSQSNYAKKIGENNKGYRFTLDNPAILQQQLEALAHHKLQMEKKENNFEAEPPPSPVSSSYSELRRASVFNKKTMEIQDFTANKPDSKILNSNYNIEATQNKKKDYKNNCLAIPYGYGELSQNSSIYDSIYEPINPRPPNEIFSRATYNQYANINPSKLPINYLQHDAYNNIGNDQERYNQNNAHRATDTENKSNSKGHDIRSPSQYIPISNDSENELDSFGLCFKCGKSVLGETSGCTAMDQIYHIKCFTCNDCQINLQGKPFYAVDGKPFCEYDYLQTLEKCSVCLNPILERILRATGKPYHPQCFTCVVCGNSLDAIPFTVDATNQNYCIADFHKKFAPRCCVCREPILPEHGQEETIRVVALDRSFHLECYKCEDCDLSLSSEADGRGCYPLDDHILCKSCNARRVQDLTNHIVSHT